MLKTKPLSQLLHQAISPNVTSAFLFTPSGSLLANASSPIDPSTKKTRNHAALAANIWSVYAQAASQGVIEQCIQKTAEEVSNSAEGSSTAVPPTSSASSQANSSPVSTSPTAASNASTETVTESQAGPQTEPLESLTLELSDYNLHIQAVTHRILLCLIGPKFITPQPSSNSSLHSNDGGDVAASLTSRAGTARSTAQGGRLNTPASQKSTGHVGSLGILKTQAQALSGYLAKELRGFEPPEGI